MNAENNKYKGISVIIPVYERTLHLKECLESIRRQRIAPSEIIIVNDGSGASARQMIESCAAHFGAKLISYDVNRGASYARNHGVKVAQGQFYFFCDADVRLCENAFEILSGVLFENPNAAFAYGDFWYGSIHIRGRRFSAQAFYERNLASTMSLLRREWFFGFDEKLRRFQDWDLWLAIIERGANGVYVPQDIFTAFTGGVMSKWMPSWMAKRSLFFSFIPHVKKYYNALNELKKKHPLLDHQNADLPQDEDR